MELSKLAGQAVELWGEGHGFADGASRLPGQHIPDPHRKFCGGLSPSQRSESVKCGNST
jgi:hypothetical protein